MQVTSGLPRIIEILDARKTPSTPSMEISLDKEHNNEKEFSNVISGKVLVGDKLFMYLPTRTIIAREKPLREILKKEDQAIFAEKIEGLSKNSPKFTCCGIHVEIGHLKEIPIESKPAYFASSRNKKQSEIPEKEGLTVGTHLSAKEKRSVNDSIENDKPVTEYNPSDDRPHIISADVSLGKRKNFITLLSGIFRKGYGRSNRKVFMRKSSGKYNKTIIGSIIGLALLVGLYSVIVVFRSTDESVKQAQENLKSAQDQISQNDYRSARSLLQSAIGSIIANDAKSAKKVRQEATILLGSIDKTSDKQPSLVAENTTLTGLLKLTLTAESKIYAINADGSVFDVSSNDYKKIGDTAAKASSYLFDDVKLLAVSSDTLAILNKTSGKTDSYKIAGFDTVKDAAIYEGNIYALNTDSILKYNDIATTEAKPANWSKDIPAIAQSLTVDGNLYVLSNDGRISIYFKGAKQSEYDLNVTPSTDARIFTSKDLPFIYLLDKTGKKVMVFDKTNGNLQTSYSLSTVGSVSDISIGSDQAIYILSSDNKIWQIR